jgi:hypothetical protein
MNTPSSRRGRTFINHGAPTRMFNTPGGRRRENGEMPEDEAHERYAWGRRAADARRSSFSRTFMHALHTRLLNNPHSSCIDGALTDHAPQSEKENPGWCT